MRSTTTHTAPSSGLLHLGDRRVHLGACLGQGSMTTAYRAVLESGFGVRRPVACKLFGRTAAEDRDVLVDTLGRAVRRASCVLHPNVVGVFELGVASKSAARPPFVLTELVEGTTLRTLLSSITQGGGRMPLDLALFIGTEAAEALAGARAAKGPDGNELGIGHSELSLRDILLSWNGEVKVKDFEIGRVRHTSSGVRNLVKLARRADAMAPEVANGETGDARSDVFSLGIVLREMLVGPRFLLGTSDVDAMKFARDGFVQPFIFEPHLPEEVRHILNRALEVDPARRYPHAGLLAYDLRRVALGLGVGDARVFLKAMLQREVAEDRSDATQPREVEKKRRRRRS